jgi:two-component system, NarL family, response regulator NreC
MPLRVVLADDHPLVRQGCRAILQREGFEVVGEATGGREAVVLTRAHRPDATVLDLSMPVVSGFDAAGEIFQLAPAAAIVCLTMHSEEHRVVAALRIGIRGYVVKTRTTEELATAVREAVAGRVFVSDRAGGAVVATNLAGGAIGYAMADDDRHLLQMLAEGKTTREIATVLNVSSKTADTYHTRLMKKLGVRDTAGLVRYAVRNGLIQAAVAGSLILDNAGWSAWATL